jgi:hypothetical protein
MLQLTNETGYSAERSALVDVDGNQIWVVVVKATFLISKDGSVDKHPEPEAICLFPRYSGEPGKSSLLREGEMVFDHPGTDITLLATAHAPEEREVRALDVSVTAGPVSKTLRILGTRTWDKTMWGPRISEPGKFTRQPIVYEGAYGGSDVPGEASDDPQAERRNPIGKGFVSSVNTVADKLLPNIEDPDHLIQAWSDRPAPVGFGPIPSNWSPRREHAGTFDDRWRTRRMPLLPEDYDRRHSQSAHPDMVSQEPLRGGEQVVLTNLTPGSRLSFRLPRVPLIFTTYTRTGRLRQEVQMDRVIIEPDANKLVMVWRSSLNCGGAVRSIVNTVVETKRNLSKRTAG